MSFCAYDLIEEQLRSSNIYAITSDHLRQRFEQLLAGNQTIRDIYTQFGLHRHFNDDPDGPPDAPGGGVLVVVLVHRVRLGCLVLLVLTVLTV